MSLTAIIATLSQPIHARNPEDVKGILSNTVVPDPDLCRSLCIANADCFYSLYHLQCDQCWQMDCSAGSLWIGGTTDFTKPTMETNYYCNNSMVPEMPTDCKNITATATVTSLSQATETEDKKGSAGLGKMVSWGPLGAMVATAIVFVL